MTICWHVDDLLCTHKSAFELTKLALYLKERFGGISVTRGDKFTYLGIDFDHSKKGEVGVSMTPYLNDLLREFPEKLGAPQASPAADHLFCIRDEEEAQPLPEEQAVAFHHTTAQLLFLSLRARRDIQTAVVFLTTRVKAPDEDDWGKLKRLLRYLKGTRGLKLILTADDMSVVKWWIDASYAQHFDSKGHTGGMMSLGKGAVTSKSIKQKIQGRSSTEDEVIGVFDMLPQVIWSVYFIEAQGYTVTQNVIK